MDGTWKALIVVALMSLVCVGFALNRLPMPDNDVVVTLTRPTTQIEMLEKTMLQVVQIIHSGYPGRPASGSHIGNGVILTAKHVSIYDEVHKVIFEDGSEYSIIYKFNDPEIDIGFCFIDLGEEAAIRSKLSFDPAPVQRGLEVFVLGNPYSHIYNSSKGIITNANREPRARHGDTPLFQTDAFAIPGSSGSAVLDEDGEIRGVLVGGYHDSSGSAIVGTGVCIPVDEILEALERSGLEVEYGSRNEN